MFWHLVSLKEKETQIYMELELSISIKLYRHWIIYASGIVLKPVDLQQAREGCYISQSSHYIIEQEWMLPPGTKMSH